jgi:hypothetical protein
MLLSPSGNHQSINLLSVHRWMDAWQRKKGGTRPRGRGSNVSVNTPRCLVSSIKHAANLTLEYRPLNYVTCNQPTQLQPNDSIMQWRTNKGRMEGRMAATARTEIKKKKKTCSKSGLKSRHAPHHYSDMIQSAPSYII